MTDRPQPDESGDVPRCVATCQNCRLDPCGGRCECAHDGATLFTGLPCLPRVRELVQISRRRCSTCQHEGNRSFTGCPLLAGMGDYGWPAGWKGTDCCSRWETKTDA